MGHGWGKGGRTRKQSVALAFGAGAGKGEIRRRPRCCGVGENWCRGPGTMSLLPPKFAAFAASSLHQLPCWGRWGCSGTRQQGRRPRAKWLEVGAELHRDTPAIPTKPTSKTRWRDPRCSRQQRGAWQHGKLGSQPWVSSGGGSKLVNHMDSRSRD